MDPEELTEEDATKTINFKPSFVLIAIDTHPSMFIKRKTDEDGPETHPFKDALTACYELADSLIFSTSRSNYSQFGIVLASDDDFRASLMEVENNLLSSVKLLKDLSSMSNEDLQAVYERQGGLDLGAFFLLCKKKFKAINSAYYKRTLIFITNDDDPVQGDAKRRFTALNEAKTFEAADIHFELISMKENLDYTKFYNELFHLYSKSPSTDVICTDKDGLFEKLQSLIVFRIYKLRCNFFPFKDDPTRFLKCMKVSFIRQAKLYNTEKATCDGRILKRLKPQMGVHYEQKHDFKLGMGFGSEPLMLDLKDKYDIFANKLPLGLHLQYVSDRQSQVGMVVNKTNILIVDPKEELKYFDQFWQYCVDRNKVLICIKKYRHPSEIRYVELIPNFANNQKMFLVKDLPYSHELKMPKKVVTAECRQFETSQEKRAAVRELIDNLSCDYDPKMLINVSLGKKKAYVKSKLLEQPEDEVADTTAKMEGMDEAIGETVAKIKTLFNFSEPVGKKRKAPPPGGWGRGAKWAK